MEFTTSSIAVAGVLISLNAFLYGVYHNLKKNTALKTKQLEDDMKDLRDNSSENRTNIEKVDLEIRQIRHEQDKFETNIESKLDKQGGQLDKIYEILLNQKD